MKNVLKSPNSRPSSLRDLLFFREQLFFAFRSVYNVDTVKQSMNLPFGCSHLSRAITRWIEGRFGQHWASDTIMTSFTADKGVGGGAEVAFGYEMRILTFAWPECYNTYQRRGGVGSVYPHLAYTYVEHAGLNISYKWQKRCLWTNGRVSCWGQQLLEYETGPPLQSANITLVTFELHNSLTLNTRIQVCAASYNVLVCMLCARSTHRTGEGVCNGAKGAYILIGAFT